jgi:LmbE family N-acetylglucosaminyl deacetylase
VRVLAVSPHLDDAVFSAGGVLARLADAGHEVTVGTCFTATVPGPTGFALACQTDKGFGPQVDYMALRRAEDAAAVAVLGCVPVHLPLPEAPHRGYGSAPELFGGVRAGDEVWRDVAALLEPIEADVLLAPQGLGGHVDHLHVVRAVATLGRPTGWWRDAPYVLRAPSAPPASHLPAGLAELRLAQDAQRRADACACYASQLGYQFRPGQRTARRAGHARRPGRARRAAARGRARPGAASRGRVTAGGQACPVRLAACSSSRASSSPAHRTRSSTTPASSEPGVPPMAQTVPTTWPSPVSSGTPA